MSSFHVRPTHRTRSLLSRWRLLCCLGCVLVAASSLPSQGPAPSVSPQAEQGPKGVELRYRVFVTETTPAEENLDSLAVRAERWLASYHPYEVLVGVGEDDTLIIQSLGPTAEAVSDLKRVLGGVSGLSFHLGAEESVIDAAKADLEWRKFEQGLAGEPNVRVLQPHPLVGGSPRLVEWTGSGSIRSLSLDSAAHIFDHTGASGIGFTLSGPEAERFSEMTANNIGRQLVMAVDGKVLQSAAIENRIDGSGRITGSFTKSEVQSIVDSLNATRFPVRLQLVHEGPILRPLTDRFDITARQLLVGLVFGVILVLVMLMLIVRRVTSRSTA